MEKEKSISEGNSLAPIYAWELYQWCSELSFEQNYKQYKRYYWTPEAKKLLNRLKYARNQLIAVIGLQGSGKTILREVLAANLENSISTKWFGKEKLMQEVLDYLDYQSEIPWDEIDSVLSDLYNKMGNKLWDYLRKINSELVYIAEDVLKNGPPKPPYTDHMLQLKAAIENKISGTELKRRSYKNFLWTMSNMRNILLDLPDYDKNNRNRMIKDLNDIQAFWEELNSEITDFQRKCNLVIFMQKELFKGHFFFGKCDVVELKPLTPQQFYDFYLENFVKPECGEKEKRPIPFEIDAFFEVAKLSRGIWRRFKKYLKICLENWYEELEAKGKWTHPLRLISIDQVKKWITVEQLEKDMELELMDIFPRSKENRLKTVMVLRYLREHGPLNQQTLAQKFFGGTSEKSQMACSRLLNKLEVYEYIRSEQKGREKIWRIA